MNDDRPRLPTVMTAPEVAELLRIATGTVRTLAKDGRLVAVSGLRNVRIAGTSVERLLSGVPLSEPDREDEGD